ncbi:MAG TPA: GNAT family N-acetyltransferase [Phycisphaerales bacterium]|nr:GNAT family N-acetyltransferase [Phycisphaerales bacterium]
MVEVINGVEMIDAVREVLREYEREIGVNLCFQGFERELAELPGAYAPPRGALLVAIDGGEVAGCVALRPVDRATCEMKRLFVRPAWRGTGLGRRLALEIMDSARRAGYRRMRLDTLPTMTAAAGMYESLGFVDIGAYYESPIAGTRFMGVELGCERLNSRAMGPRTPARVTPERQPRP